MGARLSVNWITGQEVDLKDSVTAGLCRNIVTWALFLCITKGLPTKPIEKKLGRPFLYKGRLGSFFFFFLKSLYIYVIFTITQIIMYLGRELTVVKPDYQSVHIQIFLAGRSIGEDWTTDKH